MKFLKQATCIRHAIAKLLKLSGPLLDSFICNIYIYIYIYIYIMYILYILYSIYYDIYYIYKSKGSAA